MNISPSRSAAWALGIFAAFYLFGVFPWAFFRHDDWLILGNALGRLPNDWSFAWRTTLFYGDHEGGWFFRPFFKLGTYLFFRLFHYHYYAWLTVLLAAQISAILLGQGLLTRLRGDARGALFTVLFTASVALHFASTVWMGEGMMNVPQLLLMVGAAYAFTRGSMENRKAWHGVAFVLFALSLGFKESSVFLPAFLVAMSVHEPVMRALPARRRLWALAPIVGLAGVYTIWRAFFTHLNQSYRPHPLLEMLTPPLVLLLGMLVAPLLVWWVVALLRDRESAWQLPRRLLGQWWYAPFLFLLVAPYLGHPFFSPGWLLLPGFFLLLVFVLALPSAVDRKSPWLAGAVVFVMTALPVLWQTQRLGWSQWQKGQRQLLTILQQADPHTSLIRVFECPNPEYPESNFERAIAFSHGLVEFWHALHGTDVRHSNIGCPVRHLPEDERMNVLTLYWQFPELTVVHP